jgi:alpha-L-arabinofuranosidase
MLNRKFLPLIAACLAAPAFAQNQPAQITVAADKPSHAINPLFHGVFFEDINYAADGGLYAELVQNRSFEHKESLYAWSEASRNGVGTMTIEGSGGMNAANPHFLRLTVSRPGQGYGVANSGFRGIPVKQGERYNFAVRARADEAFRNSGTLMVQLQNEGGRVLGEGRISGITGAWKEYQAQLTAASTDANAKLVVLATSAGQVDLDVVSVFPENTYKQRKNGLRADMVEMLANMKPAFFRFPGGCIVEGDSRENMYRWKNTIGDIAERKQTHSRWMNAVALRSPQYYQTFGLGFFEYFQMCEDIGTEPLPVINCGMTCQFQMANFWQCPIEDLGEFVQDALDLIEFANGPATSTWGAKRAAMGHPAPFNMKFIGVGNEQWGEDYFPRYKIFYDAIKAKYPHITVVTTAGPGVDDQWWHLAWGKFREKTSPAELVDEHYYRPPRWFYEQAERYDKYDRNGPKVFAGEFAAHGLGRRNNLHAALAEAAFMTGLVRNADIVQLAAYAPLFAKTTDFQWLPDLIWFDNTRVFATPSYHAQALFSHHRGDNVLPTTVTAPSSPVKFAPKAINFVTENAFAEYRNLKITTGGRTLHENAFPNITGWNLERGEWRAEGGVARQVAPQGGRLVLPISLPETCVITVQARKTGGPGGIGISALGDIDSTTFMLGASTNTKHQLQVSANPFDAPGKLEDNRWYEVRLELTGTALKASLDGTVLQERPLPTQKSLFAIATKENATGDIIIKAVNPTPLPVATAITLTGVQRLQGAGRKIVLRSGDPLDENALEATARIEPKETPLQGPSPSSTHNLDPYSLTILRLRPAP